MDQIFRIHEENCQHIRQFPVTVLHHPFISEETGPVINLIKQLYHRGSRVSMAAPDFLALL